MPESAQVVRTRSTSSGRSSLLDTSTVERQKEAAGDLCETFDVLDVLLRQDVGGNGISRMGRTVLAQRDENGSVAIV